MPTWRLLDLGPVDGYTMTNVYEAVSTAVGSGEAPDTLILDHPSRIFVNVGFHQLMEKEIDVGYAHSMGFDLVRRTIGGGAILDGPWEQDYFVVVNRRSPFYPATVPEFYRRFLGPPVEALRKLGLDAEVRPPNDILVGGKKISGNGAISVEGSMVLAGDLLLQVRARARQQPGVGVVTMLESSSTSKAGRLMGLWTLKTMRLRGTR